jgi:hypothetical protein
VWSGNWEGHDFSRAICLARLSPASAAEVSFPHHARIILNLPNRMQHRGRAALQRRVNAPESIRALAPVLLPTPSFANCEQTMNHPCGKNIHQPRIKPVIVEDTTCSVSLLTGTISGSNFAIP